MRTEINRSGQFRTCISLILDNNHKLFEGIVKGQILNLPIGRGGFGYDSIFKPNVSDKTFAELSVKEKNQISHRGIALKKLLNYLIKLNL